MWHAYNLISVGDVLKSTTIRLVLKKYVYLLSSLKTNDKLLVSLESNICVFDPVSYASLTCLYLTNALFN